MVNPKIGISKNRLHMHYSVGAVIKKGERYLLIERAKMPFGYAGLAGHIDSGENELEALIREVREESGLEIIDHKLLFEEELDWNSCSKEFNIHYWYLFECEIVGKLKRNLEETKSIGWYAKEQILELNLEPVWRYWFSKLNII